MSMSTEANKAIVRRFYEEVQSKGKLDLADELMDGDYFQHDPALPPELQRGRAAYMQVMRMWRSAFPDIQGTLEDIVAEGDKVASRWVWRGTHQGELMGIPATGKRASIPVMVVSRIAAGKLAEGWVVYDALGMLQQLGAAPVPEQGTR